MDYMRRLAMAARLPKLHLADLQSSIYVRAEPNAPGVNMRATVCYSLRSRPMFSLLGDLMSSLAPYVAQRFSLISCPVSCST